MSRSHGRIRWGTSLANAIFAGSILFSLFLSSAQLFQLPEFAPPQVIYSRNLVSLLLAPWTSPSTVYRVLSRLLQSALFLRLPENSIFPCYLLWIVIGVSKTLVGFLLSRSVGWAYPHLFSHWALYESIGGCGPPLVTYLLTSGIRPDFGALLAKLRGHRWEATESFVLLVACVLLVGLDHAPWTYGISILFAILAITFHVVLAAYHPVKAVTYSPITDSRQGSPRKHHRTGIQLAFLLLAFVPFPSILSTYLMSSPTLKMPPSPKDGVPFFEILLLSYPRQNNAPSSVDQPSILSQTISSYLPYISSSITLSVFTHARPFTHPSFTDAQQKFKDTPITFYADQDTHPDAYEGQHLHLAEAFRWVTERGEMSPEWVMLVEDDFPICGDWGWQGVLRVLQVLQEGYSAPSTETIKIWAGFVGTGGSGLILHRTLLPVLANTLRLLALINSPMPSFTARRPADIVIQDCVLGIDPLCPIGSSSKHTAERIWFAPRQPTVVITSRLVMDHIGGKASTTKGRVYDSNKWRCRWRHPFHGRPEVTVVPV